MNNTPLPTVKGSDWIRVLPFVGMHLGCILVFWTGSSPFALFIAGFSYFVRMFAITGFYHRYYSHRTFKTSRFVQFIFATIGCASVQRGPLWWAAHHSVHHAHSDTSSDPHSPVQRSFIWSHLLWFISGENFNTKNQLVRYWFKFPELVLLNKYDTVIPIAYALTLWLFGHFFGEQLGTSGPQLLVWGFFISTLFLYHCTFSINSLAHLFGSRPYKTKDKSRNNFILALITLGEGWHNNHHFYPRSVKQGFHWWQIDITYYILILMKKLGLIWDLRNPKGISKNLSR